MFFYLFIFLKGSCSVQPIVSSEKCTTQTDAAFAFVRKVITKLQDCTLSVKKVRSIVKNFIMPIEIIYVW